MSKSEAAAGVTGCDDPEDDCPLCLEPMPPVSLLVKIQRWDELDTFHNQNASLYLEKPSVQDLEFDMVELLQKGRCHGSDSTLLRFEYCFLTFQ